MPVVHLVVSHRLWWNRPLGNRGLEKSWTTFTFKISALRVVAFFMDRQGGTRLLQFKNFKIRLISISMNRFTTTSKHFFLPQSYPPAHGSAGKVCYLPWENTRTSERRRQQIANRSTQCSQRRKQEQPVHMINHLVTELLRQHKQPCILHGCQEHWYL